MPMMMQRLCGKLRSLAAHSAHTLPSRSSSRRLLHSSTQLPQPDHFHSTTWSVKPFFNASSSLQPSIGFNFVRSSPFPLSMVQVRHVSSRERKKRRKPMTPVTSKLKKTKIKSYSSYKSRFRTMNDGNIRRWKEGKRHNAHLKSKKSKRRLRQPATVPLAYAKVMKKLNFCGYTFFRFARRFPPTFTQPLPLSHSSSVNFQSPAATSSRSRICVKNLPRNVAEDRLRDFFSQKGEVTDAKLMRTKDGKSRQFAFVGFRTESEAEEAIKYFNKAYLGPSRITCEIAHKVGDPNIPRPWSQHSLKKENKTIDYKKKDGGTKSSSLLRSERRQKHTGKESDNDDPQLQEFLQVMQPRVKSKLWANDTSVTPASIEHGKVSQKQTQTKKESVEKSVSVNMESDEIDKMEDGSDGQVAKASQNLVHADVSDMDYFKSRVKKDWSDSDSSNSDDGDNDDDDGLINRGPKGEVVQERTPNGQHNTLNNDIPEQEERDEGPHGDSEVHDQGKTSSSLEDEKEKVLETGRLFVRNLPYTATEEELEELFSKFGTVSEAHLVVDKDTKRSKGMAYILYALQSPLQAKRMEERKKSEASGNTKGWNTLFMRADTVVENIARKYGINKRDLLDGEADDLAVRLALGETQAGVNVESLEDFAAGKTDGMKRSNHVLLVKNLPYGSSDGELAKMFGKFGRVDKIIFPPTKTLALVIFLEPAEARAAFKGLAYKRYKDAPLYLEWAPADILSQSSTSEGNEKNGAIIGEHDVKRAILEQQVGGISDVDVDPDRVESRSLYVKNLNFKTSDESLKKHFSEHMKEGNILSVKIKKHLKHGKHVSMGFGFLEFDSVETATNVCKDLQGTVLEGHALILQLCHAKKDEQLLKKVDKDRSSTKLLVRNVAFQATEKDLRQLFSPFGQIKRLRLPMKFGNHRGFAFVEFVTKQEAQNALQALSNTHLYGRHLILERAKEGESLEELRARTTAQFADEQSGFQNPTKLSKKRKQMAVLDEGSMKFQRLAE
ncbi:hypothetical protein FNV43_RR08551 [Rhamnella rubrinervis]|uniref:RRM domain-containing protein n=1 Tax=Rhamnella rubrinervis TaxID=2594499 RepID=A0A8K0MJF8_9ROSA|nr:hypothetical protein FNV43_RR08551 [Rhamnella rubrinervis]